MADESPSLGPFFAECKDRHSRILSLGLINKKCILCSKKTKERSELIVSKKKLHNGLLYCMIVKKFPKITSHFECLKAMRARSIFYLHRKSNDLETSH